MEETDLPDVPDELPVSQEWPCPPTGESPGSGGGGKAEEEHGDLPEELPLTQSDIGAELVRLPPPDLGHGAPPTAGGNDGLEGDAARSDEDGGMAFLVLVGPAQRRGRPNLVLRAALQDAALRFGEEGRPRGQVHAEGALQLLPQQGSPTPHVGNAPTRASLLPQCSVQVAERGSLVKRPLEGYPQISPMAACLDACAQLSKLEGERKDEGVLQASQVLLATGPLQLASKRFRAESMGIPERKLEAVVFMLAGAVILMDRSGRATLEKTIASHLPKADLLMYVDFCAYDETPLLIGMRGDFVAAPSPTARLPQLALSETPEQQALVRSLKAESDLLQRLPAQTAVQKILQTVQSGGVLFKVDNKFVTLLPSTICSLQVLEGCTGIALKEAQLRVSGASRAATQFQHASRVVTTDSDGANLLAERLLAAERGGHWSNLHIRCDVHRTATTYTKTFGLLDTTVTGLIHCALALQSGSAMRRFRACLRDEVASRFVVLHGTPPADAVRHKKRILWLFVSHGSRLSMRRILLAMCPNGDWRSKQVQHYVHPSAPELTEEAHLQRVTNGLIAALCASQPQTYPRHRWTGADLAIDCLAIIEACHGLLSSTWKRFAASYETASRARLILGSSSVPELGGSATGALPIAGVEEEAAAAGLPKQAVNTETQDTGNAEGQGADAADTGNTWAAINAKNRRIAAEWLDNQPLDKMMLQRLVMEPLRQLLARQFQVASHEWELEQRGRLAEATMAGQPTNFNNREYRLCLAAEGDDEERFFERLQTLFEQPELWRSMPLSSYTEEFQSLAFKCISRAGCCVKELLDHPHKLYPIKMFRLLRRPDLAATLAAEPECLLDAWSLDMKRRHPTLSGPEFTHKLAVVALLLWKDITNVESRHATVRRLLKSSSMQTHTMKVPELAAHWCLLQFRKRGQRGAGGAAVQGGSRKVTRSCRGAGRGSGLAAHVGRRGDLRQRVTPT